MGSGPGSSLRLLSFRGPKQPNPGAGRSEGLDRQDHDHWGIISTAMFLVTGPVSFYLLRFLLGVAEAGFFPGIILYLTYWFPARERAKAVALFMTAVAIAGVIGGPLSRARLSLHEGVFWVSGWAV